MICIPAHFCFLFPWDKFEVRQGCNVCQIHRFLIPGVRMGSNNAKRIQDVLPDTISDPLCNNATLQCVLIHQWLTHVGHQFCSSKFAKKFKPEPIRSCRKRAAWCKLAPLHENFEPAPALSQIPVEVIILNENNQSCWFIIDIRFHLYLLTLR